MRNFLIPSSLFAASVFMLGAFSACGGDDTNNPTGDGGPTGDGAKVDGKVPDGGGGGDVQSDSPVSQMSLAGNDEFDIAVVSGPFGNPTMAGDKGTPVPSPEIRVETPDGTSFLDLTGQADGTAKLMLDKTKGPFNITVAVAQIGAASIMGVTAPADVAGKVIWIPPAYVAPVPKSITGAIVNLTTASDSVQLDAPEFSTLFCGSNSGCHKTGGNVTSYTSSQYYQTGDITPLNMCGIEIDSSNNAVKAVWTPSQARVNGPMTQDVDFSMNAVAGGPTKSTVTVALPSTGAFKASMVKTVGDIVNLYGGTPGPWTNSTVQKNVGQTGAYVGLGLLAMPDGSGNAAFNLTTFGSPIVPDEAVAYFGDKAHYDLIYNVKTFTTGTQTVPAINTLDFGMAATSLDTAQANFDGTGATYMVGSIGGITGTTAPTAWFLYFLPGTLKSSAPMRIPALSAAITNGFADLSTASNAIMGIDAIKAPSAPTDFSYSGGGVTIDWRYSYGVNVTASGR